MPKPTGHENIQVRKLVASLKKQRETFYLDLARYISRPSRMGVAVDVAKLARFSDDVVVPGTVLGSGRMSNAGNVYALRFSKTARAKIEAAGGKCLPIESLGSKKARIVI